MNKLTLELRAIQSSYIFYNVSWLCSSHLNTAYTPMITWQRNNIMQLAQDNALTGCEKLGGSGQQNG